MPGKTSLRTYWNLNLNYNYLFYPISVVQICQTNTKVQVDRSTVRFFIFYEAQINLRTKGTIT